MNSCLASGWNYEKATNDNEIFNAGETEIFYRLK